MSLLADPMSGHKACSAAIYTGFPLVPVSLTSLATEQPLATMNGYSLQHTLPCPGASIALMEFSPNGRFLIVEDRGQGRLYVLDRLVGFRPTVEAGTISLPTSLTFESSTSFFVGFDNGQLVQYSVDLRSKHLVKGWTDSSLHGSLPVAAIALDATARVLALAVGPDVFVFNRLTRTGSSIPSVLPGRG